MNKLILILLLVFSFAAMAEEKGLFVSYSKDQSVKDPALAINESVYKFTFEGFTDGLKKRSISYSIDSEGFEADLIDGSYFTLTVAPGKHIFQFYYTDDYFEVYTDSLEIQAQYRDDYTIFLENSEFPIVVDKPVIYLYPEKRTEVNVALDAKGSDLFVYPHFNNLRHDLESWKCFANPNGDIELKGERYNYLFWESKQRARLSNEEIKQGFCVSGEHITAFFEEQLMAIGFNSKERADFITYWAPRMMNNPFNYVHFMTGERCNDFAEYIVEPAPQQIYRIYMAWMPTEQPMRLEKQTLPKIDRSGFTMVEWGGFELIPLEHIEF